MSRSMGGNSDCCWLVGSQCGGSVHMQEACVAESGVVNTDYRTHLLLLLPGPLKRRF